MKRFMLAVTPLLVSIGLASPAVAQEPIKIAALYNVTGGMSSLDGPSLQGAKLAVKQINAAGGLLGDPPGPEIGVEFDQLRIGLGVQGQRQNQNGSQTGNHGCSGSGEWEKGNRTQRRKGTKVTKNGGR